MRIRRALIVPAFLAAGLAPAAATALPATAAAHAAASAGQNPQLYFHT